MRSCPCKECENKGCGSFHDKCPEYVSWKNDKAVFDEQVRKQKEEFMDIRFIKKRRFKY